MYAHGTRFKTASGRDVLVENIREGDEILGLHGERIPVGRAITTISATTVDVCARLNGRVIASVSPQTKLCVRKVFAKTSVYETITAQECVNFEKFTCRLVTHRPVFGWGTVDFVARESPAKSVTQIRARDHAGPALLGDSTLVHVDALNVAQN